MSNSDSNLGVVGSILVFVFGLVFVSVVLLQADTVPPNIVASTICPKTRNSSLCRIALKPAGSTDVLILADYALNLARTSAAESLGHARWLEAATVNPQLKKRYLECSRRFDFVVRNIEEGKKALAKRGYAPLSRATGSAVADADGCLNIFKKPPPEPSALPKKAKNLGEICDIAVSVSSILAGED